MAGEAEAPRRAYGAPPRATHAPPRPRLEPVDREKVSLFLFSIFRVSNSIPSSVVSDFQFWCSLACS